MEARTFDPFDFVAIIAFIPSFKLACDTNRIYKGAALWLRYIFIKKQVATALKWKITLKTKSPRKRQKGRIFTIYCEVENYLLETYVTDEIVAKTHS